MRRSSSGIDSAVAMVRAMPSMSCGFTSSAVSSSFAAPANFDSTSTPGSAGVFAGTYFLGHQVHAVLQRRHQTDLRGAVKACQHGLAEPLVEISDRGPVHFAMAAVD